LLAETKNASIFAPANRNDNSISGQRF